VAWIVVFAILAIVGLRVVALAIASCAAIAVGAVIWWCSDGVALRLSGAVPADVASHARLHNLLDSLCIASGLPKPSVYVIDDVAPNAFAVGRSPRHAALAVTSGLLDVTSRIELEAVLAHELSHIRNGDITVSTLAVATLGRTIPSLVSLVVGERRESSADASAVEMTRFPPGLISALEKLRDDPAVLRINPPAIAHLWIEAPVGGDHAMADESTLDLSLDQRIAVLREL
jgi:heat shock protein HtpX